MDPRGYRRVWDLKGAYEITFVPHCARAPWARFVIATEPTYEQWRRRELGEMPALPVTSVSGHVDELPHGNVGPGDVEPPHVELRHLVSFGFVVCRLHPRADCEEARAGRAPLFLAAQRQQRSEPTGVNDSDKRRAADRQGGLRRLTAGGVRAGRRWGLRRLTGTGGSVDRRWRRRRLTARGGRFRPPLLA